MNQRVIEVISESEENASMDVDWPGVEAVRKSNIKE